LALPAMTHSAQAKRVSAAAVVRRAFEGVDAYGVARESGKKDRELTFGELDVCDFSGVCSRFTASRPCDQKDSRKIFWDLGSGAGKVVLGLALCDTFEERLLVKRGSEAIEARPLKCPCAQP